MSQKLLLKYAARLDKKASVDRLMRDALVLIHWMFAHQPTCDLLRGPLADQFGRYSTAEIVIACQLAGLWAVGTIPGSCIRLVCTIALGADIAPDFTTDGRC
ncbi:hypothetical protein AB9F29_20840 [Falsihalocynthiibacter sp. S25ZX9]|uniref:hypothetical protein n=1 Tax=Falsihalocynthiibacter sp. S25ZX9 TaxID=3240870 RepID=UPI0035109E9D